VRLTQFRRARRARLRDLTPPPTSPGRTPSRFELRINLALKVLAVFVLSWLVIIKAVSYIDTVGYVAVVAVFGILVAYFFYPPIHWLNRKLPLWAALAIIYGGTAGLVVLGVWYLIPQITYEAQMLLQDLPSLQHRTTDVIAHSPFFAKLPPGARAYASRLMNDLAAYVQQRGAGLLSSIAPAFFAIVSVAGLFILVPVVSIYMLAEAEVMKRYFLGMLPERSRGRTMDILVAIDRTVGGFIRGQIIVALFVAILASMMLLLLRVPYAIIIGIAAGVFDVVPYLGAFAGAIPGVVSAWFTNGFQNAVYVVVGFVIINQLEGHLIAPRVVGSSVGIRPLAIIFALLIGGELWGLPGLIVAVPIAGVIKVALDAVRPSEQLTNAEVQPGLAQAPREQMDEQATTTAATTPS